MKRIAVALILFLSFCGLADSVYLAQHEATGTPLLCNIENLTGCNIVASSPYANIFGIPLAEFGILFYSILFALAALELVLFDKVIRRVLQVGSLVGIAGSLYFTLIQTFVIGAFCIYCIASAIITIFIFVLAGLIEPVRRRGTGVVHTHPPRPPVHLSMPPAS